MSLLSLALSLSIAAPAHCTEAPVAKPESEILSLASFKGPQGWDESENEILGDPLIKYSTTQYEIQVSLFGGRKSRHKTIPDFLQDFEARSEGKPADKVGLVRVDGRKLQVYARRYQSVQGDPQFPEPPSFQQTMREDFVPVPIPGKDRFFVLTFHIAGEPVYVPKDHPEELKAAQAAWKKFLDSFKLKRSK